MRSPASRDRFIAALLCLVAICGPSTTVVAADGAAKTSCRSEYDPSAALEIEKAYMEALKAHDYARLRELKGKKQQLDLWKKTEVQCSQAEEGASSDANAGQGVAAQRRPAGEGSRRATTKPDGPGLHEVDGRRVVDLDCTSDDDDCLERQVQCQVFVDNNDKDGYNWLDKLPSCSCTKSAMQTHDWGYSSYDDTWGVTRKYHFGAEGGCFRSPPLDVGNDQKSAQQCCYDKAQKLITTGQGAGTPDIDAADGFMFGYDRGHITSDVDPWEDCGYAIYNQVRRPDQGVSATGEPCPANKQP